MDSQTLEGFPRERKGPLPYAKASYARKENLKDVKWNNFASTADITAHSVALGPRRMPTELRGER
jgi:hypothetical protein